LEQSKRLSVLTRSRMFDILKQLEISEINRIDESLGRKICKEAEVNTLATATIRKFGNLYTIDFKVLDVNRNKYLFTTKEEGEGQASIPSMIDNLSENVRAGLKEKISEIKTSSTNIAEITSQNLEAYQHYFKGNEFIDKLRFDLAREEFKKAIKLDSTFGLAYYRLAYAINWELKPRFSARYIAKAISLLNRIPEKERYLVHAEQARIDEGFEACIIILEEMEELYPNVKEMLFNIGDWSYHIGDLVKAKQYLEKVLTMDPVFIRALQHLTWTYRDLGLFEKMLGVAKRYVAVSESDESNTLLAEAYMLTGGFKTGLKYLKQLKEMHPDRYYLSCSIASIYYLQEQYEKAEQELKVLVEKDKPVAIQQLGSKYLARFNPYAGKYRDAIKACDKVIDFYWQSGDTSSVSYWQLAKGIIMAEGWNDMDASWNEVQKTFPFQKQIDYAFYWITLPLLYVYHDDFVLADSLAKSTTIKWWYLTVRTLIHAEKQECNKAESIIVTKLKMSPGFAKILVSYHLAECQYEQGQLDKAAKNLLQLQQIYDNSYNIRAIFYPKSFYLLGKIYEKKGDHNLAVQNYKKFLRIWKNADEDLPELIDAKKRLALLGTN
ncbi:MAG: tetratricopeptide repeat protein, partial [Cyclobacteriaceae bacterium]|nr:tetratricopeptide repeat protein [Cyclobacteriaceae bacterium]